MIRHLYIYILILSSFSKSIAQNPDNRMVVLQAFWWDFKNNNYKDGWANYLAELAPRLKSLGIDAVWIPVTVKNESNGTGYVPFDHYDLGDKYQKARIKTSMGDKDELLRMIAILKANGIKVISDMVVNHMGGAGSATNSGGQDPAAKDDGTTNKFKNFRYVCFKTPAGSEGTLEYYKREGRFSKNWQNFFPSPVNPCCSNEQNTPWWGPDIDFSSGANGLSSNVTYNPLQNATYTKDEMRKWLIWYKKQTGTDGFRFDAVKHFPFDVQEDFLWNLRFNAAWASGNNDMLAFGEFVDFNKNVLDNYCNLTQNRTGTLDFSFRNGIHQMISAQGNFNLGSLPSFQQDIRTFTAPFVNNHDTYRPRFDTAGKIIGWNTSSQLASQIESSDSRFALAYALTMAIDGAPIIYFEDLFDIGSSGLRFRHEPKNDSQLRVNPDLQNIIWCHQNLRFKEGAYLVRWQSDNTLIIERSGKAIICGNDSWDQWSDPMAVQTNFPDGTILKDYSGAAGTAERTVYGGGKVNLSIPPCNGSASRKGYSIWAPKGITQNYNKTEITTTQEWEMANDLGDSNPLSLQQGGALPWYSIQGRNVGKIFVEQNKSLKIDVFTTDTNSNIKLRLLNANCEAFDSIIGRKNLKYSKNTTYKGWLNIQISNNDTLAKGQNVWVKASYIAPKDIDTKIEKKKCSCLNNQTINLSTSSYTDKNKVFISPNPSDGIIKIDGLENDIYELSFINNMGQILGKTTLKQMQTELNLKDFIPDYQGIIYLKIQNNHTIINKKLFLF